MTRGQRLFGHADYILRPGGGHSRSQRPTVRQLTRSGGAVTGSRPNPRLLVQPGPTFPGLFIVRTFAKCATRPSAIVTRVPTCISRPVAGSSSNVPARQRRTLPPQAIGLAPPFDFAARREDTAKNVFSPRFGINPGPPSNCYCCNLDSEFPTRPNREINRPNRAPNPRNREGPGKAHRGDRPHSRTAQRAPPPSSGEGGSFE